MIGSYLKTKITISSTPILGNEKEVYVNYDKITIVGQEIRYFSRRSIELIVDDVILKLYAVVNGGKICDDKLLIFLTNL